MEFLPLASKPRTPQSRMRNRRGPEKERFFKIFEGKKIQENHWNSQVLKSNFHHTLLAPRGLSCSFNQVSLLPAAPPPPAAGAGTGLQCWGETATGPWGVKDALQPWRPKTSLSIPRKGSGNIALLYVQKWGLLPGETLEALAPCSIYTSQNSATAQKSGVDTHNFFSCMEIEPIISFN